MKINDSNTNSPHESYSEFYRSLSGPMDKVLNSRPIHLDTLNTYIQVSTSEKSIASFFWQNDKSTALFKGPQGTGKTSTIFFMHKKFSKNKTTSSIYFDMRQHQSKIPSEIWKIEKLSDRSDALFPRIRDLISSRFNELSNKVIEENNLDDNDITWRAFCYSYRHHQQVVPQRLRNIQTKDLQGNINLCIMKDIMRELSHDYSFQSMFHFIKYAYIMNKIMGKKRVSIFIDNIDQMPYATLEAAVSCANSYSSCASGSTPRNIILGKIKFRFIISCRHHNYEKLVERVHVNALGANNHYPITHSGLPDLSKIVQKRLSKVEKFGEYNFKRGIRLVHIDTKKCITAYFKQLEDSGVYSHLLMINNNNLASTLDSIKYITRNRYFPSFDEFIENYQFGSKPKTTYTKPVNALTAASCLIWGNPDNITKTIYPSNPSQIPNVLGWNGIDLMTFMLPLRIIFLMKRLGSSAGGTKMISTSVLFQKLSQCFPITKDIFIESISDMSKAKLLLFYAEGESPNNIDSYNSCKISPKSEYIVRYAPRYDSIALGYLEDLYMAHPTEMMESPQIGKSIRFQSDNVKASLIKYCYDLENAQLQVINNKNLTSRYFSIFPKEPLCEIFLKHVKISIKDINQKNAVNFSEALDSLKKRMSDVSTLEDMVIEASAQATVPVVFERGVQIIGDLRKDDQRNHEIEEIYKMMAEIKNKIENKEEVKPEQKNSLLKRINEVIGYGRNGEKALEWFDEFSDVISQANISNIY